MKLFKHYGLLTRDVLLDLALILGFSWAGKLIRSLIDESMYLIS